jgi:hypothetical protein
MAGAAAGGSAAFYPGVESLPLSGCPFPFWILCPESIRLNTELWGTEPRSWWTFFTED